MIGRSRQRVQRAVSLHDRIHRLGKRIGAGPRTFVHARSLFMQRKTYDSVDVGIGTGLGPYLAACFRACEVRARFRE